MLIFKVSMSIKHPRIAVGLSGGVDSAVAAALLQREGHEIVGITMKIWSGALKIQEGAKHACLGPGEEEDIEASERLCKKLGIAYRVLDLCDEYESYVLEYFRREYLAGRTPNPCIVCNRELKFGFLVDRAKASGLDFTDFATGHYARIVEKDGTRYIAQASSIDKDQSYFLYGLDSQRLSTIRFPLGELGKGQVRSIARELGLEVADKPESQDFIAGGDYAPVFEGREPVAGDIVTTEGKILGRHRGLPYYTIGQRRGIGVSLGTDPLYVLALDADRNQVIVGPGAGLFASGLVSSDFRFQNPEDRHQRLSGAVRIRQNHKPAGCTVQTEEEGAVSIRFEIPQRAVAPGQSAVLYSSDGRVLGGGVIDRAIADSP